MKQVNNSHSNSAPHSSGRSLDHKSSTAAPGAGTQAEVDAIEETGRYDNPNGEEGEEDEEQSYNGANEKYELFPTSLNIRPHKV